MFSLFLDNSEKHRKSLEKQVQTSSEKFRKVQKQMTITVFSMVFIVFESSDKFRKTSSEKFRKKQVQKSSEKFRNTTKTSVCQWFSFFLLRVQKSSEKFRNV
jgi:hypothetical protein